MPVSGGSSHARLHSARLDDDRGASSVSTITQEEDGWLDLGPYQDVTFWIDTKSSTNTPTITFQTAPGKDDVLFVAIAPGYAMPVAGVPAPVVVAAPMATATVPLARGYGGSLRPRRGLGTRPSESSSPPTRRACEPCTRISCKTGSRCRAPPP